MVIALEFCQFVELVEFQGIPKPEARAPAGNRTTEFNFQNLSEGSYILLTRRVSTVFRRLTRILAERRPANS